jgi:Fe-S-cluster-containing dehydrogenase component
MSLEHLPCGPVPSIDRRDFLRSAIAGGVTSVAVAGDARASIARPPMELPSKAVGILYDSTLCVGCKACMTACKSANNIPIETPAEHAGWNQGTWDSGLDLGGRTINVIKAYIDGNAAVKDRETDGFAFFKRQCLHCVDPSCVSVCPVSAMRKNPETGIVTYNKDACIGCRYCTYACPFSVPQFDLVGAFGQINKCQMCEHLQKDGKTPACCDVCPTGASLFGPVADLQKEAERRLAATPGTPILIPRGDITQDRPKHEAFVANYVKSVYGEKDGGGTQVRYLAGVSFQKLGLPKLPDHAFAPISEGLQHTLYKWMLGPLTLLGGAALLAWRSMRGPKSDDTAHG